jgi:metal-responsive CopG/Arc/MetJ family transcriptional regulator
MRTNPPPKPRPRVAVTVALPAPMADKVDEIAQTDGISRAEAVQRLAEAGLRIWRPLAHREAA